MGWLADQSLLFVFVCLKTCWCAGKGGHNLLRNTASVFKTVFFKFLLEGRHLSLFTFLCGISVTEEPLLLGFSCCWKKLCDQTLSQPSSPSKTVSNIVKINKKNPQTNKKIGICYCQKQHISSIYFSQTASTEIFQDLSYQLWHCLQCRSLGVSDCIEQLNCLSRSWGAIQGIFLVPLYCNTAHQTGTAVLENFSENIHILLTKWASKTKIEFRYLFSLLLSSFWKDRVMVNDTFINLKARTYA